MKLSPLARSEIHDAGLTVAGYVRHWWPDGKWRGDSCGCPDDRCRGFHHYEDEDCGCLPVCIEQVTPGAFERRLAEVTARRAQREAVSR